MARIAAPEFIGPDNHVTQDQGNEDISSLEDEEEPDPDYQNNFWYGLLPTAEGTIAKI